MSAVTERVVELRLTPYELSELRSVLHQTLALNVGGLDHTPTACRARTMRKLLDQLEVARRPEAVA